MSCVKKKSKEGQIKNVESSTAYALRLREEEEEKLSSSKEVLLFSQHLASYYRTKEKEPCLIITFNNNNVILDFPFFYNVVLLHITEFCHVCIKNN